MSGDERASGRSVAVHSYVPVRLNIAVDDKQLEDFFLWDIDNEEISAEDFARQTCLDCDLPVVFEEHITAAIHTQVARARTIAQCPDAHHKTITVHLDMTFGGLTLRDNLLWGTDAVARGEPEDFARQTVADLALSDAFVQPIAFSIREQVFLYQLSVAEHRENAAAPLAPVAPAAPLFRSDDEKIEWGPLLSPAATAKLIAGSTLVNCSKVPFRDLGTVTSVLK